MTAPDYKAARALIEADFDDLKALWMAVDVLVVARRPLLADRLRTIARRIEEARGNP